MLQGPLSISRRRLSVEHGYMARASGGLEVHNHRSLRGQETAYVRVFGSFPLRLSHNGQT